jgi:hypothetical protein
MPEEYDLAYARLLADVAGAAADPAAEVTPFWPIVGWKYDGSLMVIGRSVNGWIENWPLGQLADPVVRREVTRRTRADAEPLDRCRMLWVTDLAGPTQHHYNTNRSAFWRVLRALSLDLAGAEETDWPSALAWTNLYKVAPAAGWNPGPDLQRAQRNAAIPLLGIEIETLRPKRILALTGRGWIAPFLEALGDDFEWRSGLVEGVGRRGSAAVVVARHPMKKPHLPFVREVRAAFDELGV